jgi:hypothetical protein
VAEMLNVLFLIMLLNVHVHWELRVILKLLASLLSVITMKTVQMIKHATVSTKSVAPFVIPKVVQKRQFVVQLIINQNVTVLQEQQEFPMLYVHIFQLK